MTAAGKVTVRVLPRRAITLDGRLLEAGAEATVPKADAEALIAEGYAEPAGKSRRAEA